MIASKLGFGIVGTLDPETVKVVAIRAEAIGIHSLWVNDTPGGDSLARLAIAARATARLHLATGVIPVDRKPASQICEEVEKWGLPLERLSIGIGSSAKPGPLKRVEESIAILEDHLEIPVFVGSLGPRMRKLGAERSNGLLFNWLTPGFARETSDTMRVQANLAGNASVESATYIRTALGPGAFPRLEKEAARYAQIPAYAANFERLGISAMETAVFGDTPETIVQGISAFDGAVDIAIVRAITPSDELRHYMQLLDAIAPLAQQPGPSR